MPTPHALPADFMLEAGSHSDFKAGACLLEAVSYLAGERHSDTPACVSPVLAAFGRCANDNATDADRQQLLPLAARLVSTNEPAKEAARLRILVDFAVCEAAPLALEKAGLTEQAAQLRDLAGRPYQQQADAADAAADADAADADDATCTDAYAASCAASCAADATTYAATGVFDVDTADAAATTGKDCFPLLLAAFERAIACQCPPPTPPPSFAMPTPSTPETDDIFNLAATECQCRLYEALGGQNALRLVERELRDLLPPAALRQLWALQAQARTQQMLAFAECQAQNPSVPEGQVQAAFERAYVAQRHTTALLQKSA